MTEPNNFYAFARTILSTILTLGLISSLMEYKYDKKRVLTIIGIYLFYVCFSSWLIINLVGLFQFGKLFIFTISCPALLLLYKLDKNNAPLAIFNYMTQFNIALLITNSITLIGELFHFPQLLDLILRVIVFLVVFLLEWILLREPFHRIIKNLKGNWVTLAFIPVAFAISTVIIGHYPNHYSNHGWRIIYLYSAYLVMIIVYLVIFKTMARSYRTLETKQKQELLSTHTNALTKQLFALSETETKLAIYRHDMYHHLGALSILLKNEKYSEALEHIHVYINQVMESNYPVYCENNTVNVMLTYYLAQAEEKGICVESKLDIPEIIFLDAIELSIVFANSIENAINACDRIPASKEKRIKLTCISSPQFVLEVSNTYYGNVNFDKNGTPITKKENHGIGSKSIAAFIKKNNGIYDYITENGWFKLRILINLPD